jgi:hypothetical protein
VGFNGKESIIYIGGEIRFDWEGCGLKDSESTQLRVIRPGADRKAEIVLHRQTR